MLTVVTGPPCSGKTTYVQQNAARGDAVVDFDVIAQGLGSPVSHGHSESVKRMAVQVRAAAIDAAIRRHRQGGDAWVVDSRPAPPAVRRYLEAGARMVDLTAPAAELHRRADEAGRPAAWHDLIDQFTA